MNNVATGLLNEHWLTGSHRYRNRGKRRGENRLRADLSNRKVHSDLSEYIGISAPVHSMDGWSLLGRAIACLLRGDPYNAVHLAYYAELRAALAILASQGIGVFSAPHCVIDSNGSGKLVEALDEEGQHIGNHQWTWLVFQWWAQEPRAVDLLRKVILPGRETLGTWVDAMRRAGFVLSEIGADWLRLWGIDIGRYLADRDARNATSYWPSTINPWEPRTTVEDYQAVSNLWLPLEPSSEARFAELDRHLLRIVLVKGYFGASGKRMTSEAGRTGLEVEVEYLLDNMGMQASAGLSWREFLTNSEVKEPTVIQMANGKSKFGEKNHVVEVMSRATMLLRLATGASANLLFEAGIEREDLDFWIQAVGTGRGIWHPDDSPDELIDLWADVDSVLQQIELQVNNRSPSPREMWQDESKGLAILGECERVALWGLGL